MADYQAIMTTCEAVIYLLRSNSFDNELEFKVYATDDFALPMDVGVSLFLYRIVCNGTHRIPAGRVDANGKRQKTKLPLDLHFLLTIWAKGASLQHTIAGWMMRTMEDYPILPVGLLNTVVPDVFQANETVELCLADLTNEDLMRIWEALPQETYRLSIPYMARSVRIESTLSHSPGELIQRRTFDYRKLEGND